MPEYLRSLVVIIVLAVIFFYSARPSVYSIINAEEYTQLRNIWLILTIVAFISQNFWIYVLIATPLLIYLNRRGSKPLSLYFGILFILPTTSFPISGMGIVNYIFDLSHARMLALVILLPAMFVLRRQKDTLSFGHNRPDKIIASYLVFTALLFLRDSSLTNTLRGTFYLFIDIFLPYYVISRALKNMQVFRESLLSLVMAIMIIAVLAIFESYKSWLLYASWSALMGTGDRLSPYLARDGLLRVMVTAGHAIVLGYLMVIGIGMYLFFQRSINQKVIRYLGMCLLLAGLIASLSRGPWVGAAILFVVFTATGQHAVKRLLKLLLLALFVLSLLSTIPGGDRVINLLPFIGSTEKETVTYRENLLTNSIIVIKRNLWIGSVDPLNSPEMEEMRQGEGIIDLVNTYVQIALNGGLVGLGLFVAFFAMILIDIYLAMRSIPDKDDEKYILGRALFSVIFAILVMIFTMSSISMIPIMYWAVGAMGVAYAQMVRKPYSI